MEPRQVLPGATYLVTRRCTQRQFLLRPSALTNQIVAYCFAYAAEKSGVQLHALCVMSNHYHAIVTDPNAQISVFLNQAHLFIAKCINASYGHWENVWSTEAASTVRLIDDCDVFDKLVYVLCNPVSAGLVSTGAKWPGLRSRVDVWCQPPEVVARPKVFFPDTSTMPEQLALTYTRPPMFATLSDADLAAVIEQHVAAHEADTQQEMAAEGRAFAGEKAVRETPWTQTAKSYERKRRMNPQIAAKKLWHRLQAIAHCKAFVAAYRRAYRAWRAGDKSVVFPHGTYAMRIYANVCCAPI